MAQITAAQPGRKRMRSRRFRGAFAMITPKWRAEQQGDLRRIVTALGRQRRTISPGATCRKARCLRVVATGDGHAACHNLIRGGVQQPKAPPAGRVGGEGLAQSNRPMNSATPCGRREPASGPSPGGRRAGPEPAEGKLLNLQRESGAATGALARPHARAWSLATVDGRARSMDLSRRALTGEMQRPSRFAQRCGY